MKVEVLASVMNEDFSALVRRMRLESDAVLINQCDRLEIGRASCRERVCAYV